MKKRRFVSTIFSAVVSFAASAVSFNPAENSTVYYEEGPSGEFIFVGEADSANIKIVLDKTENISSIQLVSGTSSVDVTDSLLKIGTGKCYSVQYTIKGRDDKEATQTSHLCYVKKAAVSPTVRVCDYDSVSNTVCGPELKVKFHNLDYVNSYVNVKGETIKIKDNYILSYIDYEAEGINIKEKSMEVIVTANDDTTMFVTKPRRRTVFKLKDKLTQYEFISDTFYTRLPFMTAQISVDGEEIPHNIERRNKEALVFGTKEEALANVSSYMYSGPLVINLERNTVDNAPVDTVVTVDANDTTKTVQNLVPVDARYTWKFYNDSTCTLRSPYNTIPNSMTINDLNIDQYGTHFVVLTCDNSVCKDNIIAGFKVRMSHLEMPYVFTPNGDGYNDEFRPTYTSISEYKIRIYNTMGIEMYESEDITVGWDGTHKGHEAPIGAYYYVVKAKGVDGIEYKLKGTVNLVRNAD